MAEDYEDERDITEIGLDEPMGSARVTFDVPMPTVEQVTGEIARQLIASFGDYKARADLMAIAKQKLDDAITAKIADQVEPVLDQLLSQPLQPTDGFGNPVGEPTSLQGLIAHHVTQWASTPVNSDGVPMRKDPYSSKANSPRIDWALGQLVNGEMKKAIQVEVDKLKTQLKANATAHIAKQIADQVANMVLK